MEEKDRGLVVYQSRDGQEIRLSFDVVRKYLISGHPEMVTEPEIMIYMGMCKARGLNPFKRDCYLVKYTPNDPAATIVSIDYYRSRARAQSDCVGWEQGIIVQTGQHAMELRKGAIIMDGEKLIGGWFRARPKGWEVDLEWTVPLNRYIKTTKEGRVTRFWAEDNQPEQIAKVAESQGLRRAWPDEFAKLYIKEEIIQGIPIANEPLKMPTAIESILPPQTKPEQAEESKPAKAKKEKAVEWSAEERKAAALETIAGEDFDTLPEKWLTDIIRGMPMADQLDICRVFNERKQGKNVPANPDA